MTRWEALVRYDDEIRAAAETLAPFGAEWVDKLGEAFFALDEDRRYLPSIVTRLAREAEHAAVLRWLKAFSKTADGAETSPEALDALLVIQASGYTLRVDRSGTFEAMTGSSTSYLRSSGDIVRFAKILSARAERAATAPDQAKGR
ncbi:MAG: hypothetical protein NW206_20900 [Hyphomonadaceae bacterium]|nr:hypothetical protein [Hyphomonadaceae bacterium]